MCCLAHGSGGLPRHRAAREVARSSRPCQAPTVVGMLGRCQFVAGLDRKRSVPALRMFSYRFPCPHQCMSHIPFTPIVICIVPETVSITHIAARCVVQRSSYPLPFLPRAPKHIGSIHLSVCARAGDYTAAMPRKVVTPQEELDNLNRRAAEVHVRMGKKRVQLAMNSCPSCIPHLCKALDSLGYDDTRISKPEEVAVSFQTQANRARQQVKRSGSPQVKAEGGGDQGPDSPKDKADLISSTYWRLDSLSFRLIRDKLLPQVDAKFLSAPNLRATVEKLGTAQAKDEALRILEVTTGLGNLSLVGALRSWSELQALVRNRATIRGPRARELSLPPTWESEGLFLIDGCDPEKKQCWCATASTRGRSRCRPPSSRSSTTPRICTSFRIGRSAMRRLGRSSTPATTTTTSWQICARS